MHDSFPMFKILIVVLVVAYQGLQALRRRAANRPASQATPPPDDCPSEDDATPFPYPAPSRTDPEIPLRIAEHPVQQTAPVPISEPLRMDAPKAESLVNIRSSSDLRSGRSPSVPSLADLILSQVVLAPPPGLRGIARDRTTTPVGLRR